MSDSANAVPCCRCGLPVASGIIIDDGTSYHIDCACGPDANLQIENTRLRSLLEDLVRAVDAYLAELDAPVPDYTLRRKLLGDLRRAREDYLKAKIEKE